MRKNPGCVTYGETIEEAVRMAKEAIELYIESLKDHHEEIPMEKTLKRKIFEILFDFWIEHSLI